MRFVNDLKEELSYYKDVLRYGNIFNRKVVENEPLVVETLFINDTECSDDFGFIVSRLKNFFKLLEVKYGNDVVEGFIGEIKRIIYNILSNDDIECLWKYNMAVMDNNRHYQIVLVNRDKAIMRCVIVTMDDGRFLSFDAKYYLDLLNYNFNIKMDTTVVVSLNDMSNGEKCGIYSVYNVDLLNGNLEISNKMLDDSLVSSLKLPLSSNKRKKY